jgi:fructose-1,6-bisphosphatase/inositol monophosphatase family enzyme
VAERNQIEDRIEAVAVAAARQAGSILRAHARRARKVDKAAPYDLKLEVDRLCEEAITRAIREAFCDHRVLAEEGGTAEAEGGYQWIIDPLDGTVNFFYGLPYYSVSVACYESPPPGGRPPRGIHTLGRGVVGVVYAPPTGELFVGRDGRGATCNGRAIHVSDVRDLAESILCTGFGKALAVRRGAVRASALLAGKVRKMRCLGSAAYDIANVACGRLSAFFENGLRTWDIAAGAVLLMEAGGVIDATEYEPTRWNVIAAAPGIHQRLREELSAIGDRPGPAC